MGKLIKFLKPHAGAVLAILCVLIVQAWCDLSLPTYTSDIVNVGIQQGGVDESVPEQISGDELEKLLLFIPSEDQDTVQNAYSEVADGSYDYDGTVYELKESVMDSDEDMRSCQGSWENRCSWQPALRAAATPRQPWRKPCGSRCRVFQT